MADEDFPEGWLTEHLRRVMDRLRATPPELRPRLTPKYSRVNATLERMCSGKGGRS